MILLFNACLGLLLILMINKIVDISHKGYWVFLFYLVVSSFLYWYVISAVLHFQYGTFLSLSGAYFYIATRTQVAAWVFYISSAFIVLGLTFILYFISRKYIFEKKHPKKIINKKIVWMIILVPIFILAVMVILIPPKHAYESSPLIDIVTQFFKSREPNASGDFNLSYANKPKLLNISLDIKKPNVIIIMLESIAAEHMPFYGYERNITPNIDLFFNRAIAFNNSYSAASHSDYSQPSFLSSRYMLINSYRNFFDKDYPRTFIWDILKEEDYATAYISAQDDNWANMINYYNKDTLDVYEYSISDGSYDYGSGNARKDYDEVTASKVIDWLDETSDPFFLYVNLQATHYPYVYPEGNSIFLPDKPSFFTSYHRIPGGDYAASLNSYDNSIYYVDKQVGKLLDYFEKENYFEDTIIVISSDHGEILEKRHDYFRHGFGVYNEETKIPLAIYLPGQESRIINERVRHLDVIPTLLDISNLSQSENFQGHPMTEDTDIFLIAQNQNFKLGLIKNDLKYILDGLNFLPEVYNITEDPYEMNNLVEASGAKDTKYTKYGYLLYKWYKCQTKYYKDKLWEKGKRITCP